MAAVAAVLVCVFGVSVRSEAGRAYFMKMWNFVSGNELRITMDKENGNIRSLSEQEEKANQAIKNQLNVEPIKLMYAPQSMKFLTYSINGDVKNCMEVYEINGVNFNIQIFGQNGNDSLSQIFDGELVGTVVMNAKQIEVPIYKIADDNSENMLMAQFEYDDTYYVISSSINREEFTKILQNIEI